MVYDCYTHIKPHDSCSLATFSPQLWDLILGEKVTGPFFPNDRNPILTSRNLSYDNWVHSTGHADLFQLPDGRSLGIDSESIVGCWEKETDFIETF